MLHYISGQTLKRYFMKSSIENLWSLLNAQKICVSLNCLSFYYIVCIRVLPAKVLATITAEKRKSLIIFVWYLINSLCVDRHI